MAWLQHAADTLICRENLAVYCTSTNWTMCQITACDSDPWWGCSGRFFTPRLHHKYSLMAHSSRPPHPLTGWHMSKGWQQELWHHLISQSSHLQTTSIILQSLHATVNECHVVPGPSAYLLSQKLRNFYRCFVPDHSCIAWGYENANCLQKPLAVAMNTEIFYPSTFHWNAINGICFQCVCVHWCVCVCVISW